MSYQILSKEDYENKLHQLFPTEDFTVIKYTKAQDEVEIRCNICNTIYKNKRGRGFYNNKYICRHCASKTFQKFLQMCENDNLEIVSIGKRNRDDTFLKCKNCNQIFTKHVDDTTRNGNEHILCPFCKSPSPSHKYCNYQKLLDDAFGQNEYVILVDNCLADDKVPIKHNKCGFIHFSKVHNFIKSSGCPKCFKKRSRGELRVEKVLTELELPFIQEYPIANRQRLDFYVNNDFAIEFNGIQHYEEDKERNKYDTLENNKRRDKQKQNWCKENNIDLLIIPYYEYKNIREIIINFIAQRPGYETVGKA